MTYFTAQVAQDASLRNCRWKESEQFSSTRANRVAEFADALDRCPEEFSFRFSGVDPRRLRGELSGRDGGLGWFAGTLSFDGFPIREIFLVRHCLDVNIDTHFRNWLEHAGLPDRSLPQERPLCLIHDRQSISGWMAGTLNSLVHDLAVAFHGEPRLALTGSASGPLFQA